MLIKKIVHQDPRNYCELFRRTCIKEECGAFTTQVPITKEERERRLMADIPVDSDTEPGMYCIRYQKRLIPSFRHNDKGNLVRVF
jgi:hypothetical protein